MTVSWVVYFGLFCLFGLLLNLNNNFNPTDFYFQVLGMGLSFCTVVAFKTPLLGRSKKWLL